MQTQCISDQLEFEAFDGRRVVAGFDGGLMTSDAGSVLLRETDRVIALIDQVAACFTDGRRQADVVHTVRTLVGQRIVGIALGYEDVNHHDSLRFDPVLALFSERLQPRRKDCAALAGKSTINRLEHARRGDGERYHKIGHDPEASEAIPVDVFLASQDKAPREIVIDLDATDDPVHGRQEGRFFHGYYDCYCYLPLYIFWGPHLLAAKLRRSNIDASAGAKEEVARIVAHIRRRWPRVKIVLRADSGFAREALMAWCEANRVDYVFGLARNSRLVEELAIDLAWAESEYEATGKPARRFKEFFYTTRDSWSRRRRVIGKAEHLTKGANPRFIVTSLKRKTVDAKTLYERVYCARGDMENRIKGEERPWRQWRRVSATNQLDLFADRTSTATLRANQLRLWFSSFAYVLIEALQRIGLGHTEFENATAGTIRLKLFKIGARVTVSVRRIKIAMASACPYQAEFALAHARLRASPG